MWKENIWRKKKYFCAGEKQWRRKRRKIFGDRKCHHGGTKNKQGKIWIFLGEIFLGDNFLGVTGVMGVTGVVRLTRGRYPPSDLDCMRRQDSENIAHC